MAEILHPKIEGYHLQKNLTGSSQGIAGGLVVLDGGLTRLTPRRILEILKGSL
jgi:hypothetical protein